MISDDGDGFDGLGKMIIIYFSSQIYIQMSDSEQMSQQLQYYYKNKDKISLRQKEYSKRGSL